MNQEEQFTMNNPYSPQARAVETLSIMLELLNKKHISDLKSLNDDYRYQK